ncbi:MAG: hypothetical protein AAGE52_09305 [Myxococcota bacterium]
MPRAALTDLRLCERGWPTTKAGRGNGFHNCTAVRDADGTEAFECEDQEGPCRRP